MIISVTYMKSRDIPKATGLKSWKTVESVTRLVMGKNRKKGRRVRATVTPSISGGDTIVRMTGKFLVQSATLGTSAFQVRPLIDPRLAVIATVYQEFRFLAVTVKLHSVGTGAYTVSYYKTVPVTAPASLANAYEATCSRLMVGGDTNPQTLSITKRDLLGGARVWYQANPQTTDTSDDSQQGVIYMVDTVGVAKTLEFAYRVEFRGITTPQVL